MGIQGLLPLLKSIMVPIHIKDLEGCSVAVDTYSWLHKGALSCSRELCKGQPTSKHINYCMHRVNLLRHHGVKPILVFDGGHLPMKGEQENKRARSRKENLARAIEHELGGNSGAAYECYQKAVDISPSIAYELIQVLKQENVSYVVAPYEADAQMTFLAVSKQVDAVITEDSDLIPFGCSRIIYKMDKFGQGVEFRSSILQQNKELSFTGFTEQMFLEMCILSGCDYLPSLPGMGLKRAHGLIRKFKSYDKVIKHLKYGGVAVAPLYEESFKKAILTFHHQRVYDPITEDLVHLTDLSGTVGEDIDFLGPLIPQHIAKGIATGDLDPFTKMPFQRECFRASLDGIYESESVKHEGQRKKIDLPVQKNLLSNYFCFASLEAKRKFRVPRVTPKHPTLGNETHPGKDTNETAISYNGNCSPETLTFSNNLGIADPTKNPVDNGGATKSSVSLEPLTHGADDTEDDLRSPHPCIVVNKGRQCNFDPDGGKGKMRIEQKNVIVRSSYFQHTYLKENVPENKNGKVMVKEKDLTRCKSSIAECEFKSSLDAGEEVKLKDSNPIVRSSNFQIKSVKTIDQERRSDIIALDTHGSSIPKHITRVESGKVVVRSSYFQQKKGKENDQENKFDELKEGVATDACENSIPENTNIKRKVASVDNVQTIREHLSDKRLRTSGPLLIQSTGTSTPEPEDSVMETKDEEDRFGCNISHLGQYSDISGKSMEKFVSVLSSFRYSSGSRASGLRAPLKDVRNTCTNSGSPDGPDGTNLSKFAYVPTKRKASLASRR